MHTPLSFFSKVFHILNNGCTKVPLRQKSGLTMLRLRLFGFKCQLILLTCNLKEDVCNGHILTEVCSLQEIWLCSQRLRSK